MDKKEIMQALKTVKENSPKRNFKQTIDLIINLKDLNLKNPDNHLNLFIPLQFNPGKKISVCGLVGPELKDQAKEVFDETIMADDFPEYQKDTKKTKQAAQKHHYFVAQATIMPAVAKSFGRVLGSRGKMPNPKGGCVVPPIANLKVLYEKLQKTAKVLVKTSPIIQCIVGKEDQSDEEIVDNVLNIYNNIVHNLPNEENNIKNVILKFTMGPAVLVGKASETKKSNKKEKKEEKTKEETAPVEEKQEKASEKKQAEEKPDKKAKEEPQEEKVETEGGSE